MNRRRFISSLLGGVAAVVVAPLMRRSEVQSVGSNINNWGPIPPRSAVIHPGSYLIWKRDRVLLFSNDTSKPMVIKWSDQQNPVVWTWS